MTLTSDDYTKLAEYTHLDDCPKAGDLAYPDSTLDIYRINGAEGWYELSDGKNSFQVHSSAFVDVEEWVWIPLYMLRIAIFGADTMIREIPEGYERIDHHDNLTLHNEEKGIVISVLERDPKRHLDLEEYEWKVSGARNQETFYDGVFQSLSHAEDKALELAAEH